MYVYLVVLAVACAFGFQGWRNVLNNFVVETVGLNGQQNGMLQGMREVPGFLTFLIVYPAFGNQGKKVDHHCPDADGGWASA